MRSTAPAAARKVAKVPVLGRKRVAAFMLRLIELRGSPLRRQLCAVVAVHLVRRGVLHHPRHLRDELLVVPGPAEKMEPHLHSGGDSARGDDASLIDHAGPRDPALWRDLREAVDRRYPGRGLLHARVMTV